MVAVKISTNFLNKKLVLDLEKDHYQHNNNLALLLYQTTANGSRELWSVVTTNTDTILPKNMVAIKDYSDGTGNLDMLIGNGIISQPVFYVPSGFVNIPVCELLCKELQD